MHKIKSDDQRAKTMKHIEGFEKDAQRFERERGKKAAASYRRIYQDQVAELREQVERYDVLKKAGPGPFHGDLGSLGPYLVDARVAAGLTQKDLAKKLGVSQPMVFKYELSEYRSCTVEVIEKVIAALGLDLDVEIKRARPKLARAGA